MIEARRAAGHRNRPSFCKATGLKKRSLEAVELYEPSVGEGVLQDIGRALSRYWQDWSADTPWVILDDGPIPQLVPVDQVPADQANAMPPQIASMLDELEYFRGRLGADDFFRLMALIEAMTQERMRLEREREQSNPDSAESDRLEDTG